MVDSLLGNRKAGTARSRFAARLVRSVVLGSVAVAFAIYWLAESYGADTRQLVEYLKASAAFVLFFVLTGVLAGLVIWAIGWFRNR
jgi:hypothetical protein